jgi:D-alanine-D-alanine ligase-like ATP-grasp enzyme
MGKEEKFGDDARQRHLVSPLLSPELQKKLQEVVLRLHEVVGAAGLTRTDILILPDNELVVLEMNGIPGLLESSIACDAAAAAGISFPELCEAYVQSAFLPRAEPDVWHAHHAPQADPQPSSHGE